MPTQSLCWTPVWTKNSAMQWSVSFNFMYLRLAIEETLQTKMHPGRIPFAITALFEKNIGKARTAADSDRTRANRVVRQIISLALPSLFRCSGELRQCLPVTRVRTISLTNFAGIPARYSYAGSNLGCRNVREQWLNFL